MSVLRLHIDDIGTWNLGQEDNLYSFTIPKITEEILPDSYMKVLADYIEDSSGETTDIFNTEYLGYLSGQFSGSGQQLIGYINEFFNEVYPTLGLMQPENFGGELSHHIFMHKLRVDIKDLVDSIFNAEHDPEAIWQYFRGQLRHFKKEHTESYLKYLETDDEDN